MKKILLISTLFILGINSFAASLDPNFNFMYKDRTSGHTYNIYFYIENIDGGMSTYLLIGDQFTMPMGQSNSYSTYGFNVPDPIPPAQINCFRVAVVVVRNDYQVRRGYSDWTSASVINSGTLNINVTSFDF